MSLSGRHRLVMWQPTRYKDAKSKYLPVCYCNEHCIPFHQLAYMEECKWYFEVDGVRRTRQEVVDIFRDVPQYDYKTKKFVKLEKIPGYRRRSKPTETESISIKQVESHNIEKSKPEQKKSEKLSQPVPESKPSNKRKVIPLIPVYKSSAKNTASTGMIQCIETNKKFKSQAEAARFYKIDSAQVSDSIKTGRPRSGYTFKRI